MLAGFKNISDMEAAKNFSNLQNAFMWCQIVHFIEFRLVQVFA